MPQPRNEPEPTSEEAREGLSSDRSAPPRGLRVLRVGLVAEAAVLAVAAVAVVVDLVARGGRGAAAGAFLVLCALGVAWALLAAGRALRAGRRGGRAVAMTWQIFQGIVGASALAAGNPWAAVLGVVLLVLAAGIAFLLLTPRVVEATTR
jgi:hypothetical protein